ncbi:MAG: lytic transglycosylase domain-containing protein [Clostridia bacterium]|nr:lytic transglycosylase domain-containing protein [Clostridia bacterium]
MKTIAAILIFFIGIAVIMQYSGRLIYPMKYRDYVFFYSEKYNIDPFLVFAIIKAESNFNSKATSKRNARGLMQITDRTGRWGAEKLGIGDFMAEDLYDPETNISIGCWYLAHLMKQFDGDVDLVIAAYNGGSGKVSEWLKNKEYSDTGENLDRIPFSETRIYLDRVRNNYTIYKELYEKDF